MKGRPIDQLVYEVMFPKPRQQDPHNFQALLQRHLVLEVRQEVHSFYGHLDTQEAKYPGLDYTHPVHRIRLSRWPWHRRLFRAFDALRLTHAEISNLTKWEGTKWAKERFEKEQGIIIHDTTADDFSDFVEPEDRVTPAVLEPPREEEEEEERAEDETPSSTQRQTTTTTNNTRQTAAALAAEESDEDLQSVGVALNERLRERVALRNLSGDMHLPLDEEWETWLKNALESGQLGQISRLGSGSSSSSSPASSSGSSSNDVPSSFSSQQLSADDFPRRMVAAARAGHWEQIPEFLHAPIRQGLAMEHQPPLRTRQQRFLSGTRRIAVPPPPPPPEATTSESSSSSSLAHAFISREELMALGTRARERADDSQRVVEPSPHVGS